MCAFQTLGDCEQSFLRVFMEELVPTVAHEYGIDNDLNDASDQNSIAHNNIKLVDDEIVCCEK